MKTATSELNGNSVTIGAWKDGIIFLHSFSPERLADHPDLLQALAKDAAAQLGSKPDRRFTGKWSLAK